MTAGSDPDRSAEAMGETICDYLYWVRRRLIYQALLDGRDRIDKARCLSTQENRNALAQMLEQPPAALTAAPPVCRGSMRYVAVPAAEAPDQDENA